MMTINPGQELLSDVSDHSDASDVSDCARLALPEGHVHLWQIALDGPAREHEALSTEERERGARFIRPADRDHFLNAHSALRDILSRYTGRSPAALAFETGPHGKPALRGSVRFNLSHSGGRMLLAVARSREVGVDLEAFREGIDIDSIAARYFSPEEAGVLARLSSSEKTERFYAIWTATEARLKARGIGFLETEPVGDRARWRSIPIPVPPGFAAALAVEGALPQLEYLTCPN